MFNCNLLFVIPGFERQLMVHLLNESWNGVESEWIRIEIKIENHNKLCILFVKIRFGMSWIAIDVFILSWNLNRNELDYCKLIKKI